MTRGSASCGSRWLLLSDGALPTEDIYFMGDGCALASLRRCDSDSP